MHRWLVLLAALTLFVGVGCTRQVAGTAQPDPNRPRIQVSKDGYGIDAGFADAPVSIEIYTEPQCSHCAEFQRDFGEAIRSYLATGQLKVTYRPMTFLDKSDSQYSARVANALFIATGPGAGEQAVPGGTTATVFQSFVEELWSHQDGSGQGPSDDEMADMARRAGVPAGIVAHIASGDPVIDTDKMEDTNFEFLYEIDSMNTGTPTVYDMVDDRKVDIFDNDWLTKLIASA